MVAIFAILCKEKRDKTIVLSRFVWLWLKILRITFLKLYFLLYAHSCRELQIFSLNTVRLYGESKEGIAKFG